MIKAEEINTFFKKSIEMCTSLNTCNGCPLWDVSQCCRTTHLTQEQVDLVMAWKPHVDWSKVPVDTRVIVWDDEDSKYRRYFAKYENGEIYAFDNGVTSWSDEVGSVTGWKYGKLAEDE